MLAGHIRHVVADELTRAFLILKIRLHDGSALGRERQRYFVVAENDVLGFSDKRLVEESCRVVSNFLLHFLLTLECRDLGSLLSFGAVSLCNRVFDKRCTLLFFGWL